MFPPVLIEIYGYIGSALVVISMLMSSVVKLRVINTIGSIISGTYALIIGSFPLALMNICLIIINVYNLIRLLKTKQEYRMVEVEPQAAFLNFFLEEHAEDIRIHFPRYQKSGEINRAFLVCCNGTPAGVMLGVAREGGELDVRLDYSTPEYRDCSLGAYLYGRLPEAGINMLKYAEAGPDSHNAYLTRMGFVENQGVYSKKLA